MNHNNKIILVTGATGQQGGAVVHHLLDKGWTVRGMTRNLSSPAAQALSDAGVKLVQGDLSDRTSLDRALTGVYAVFSFPNLALGVEVEAQQGKTMADAAKAAGVKHFVQASVGGAERDSGVPHFESKWQIEEYVRAIDLPATFLRPVFFMENFYWKRDQILNGTFESWSMKPDKALQMIAVDDIGKFAALIFENPQKYIGQGLEIAGDELTEPQMRDILAKVTNHAINLVPPAGPPPNKDMARMFAWFNETGYKANISALRAEHPGLMTFETWLQSTGWNESS